MIALAIIVGFIAEGFIFAKLWKVRFTKRFKGRIKPEHDLMLMVVSSLVLGYITLGIVGSFV